MKQGTCRNTGRPLPSGDWLQTASRKHSSSTAGYWDGIRRSTIVQTPPVHTPTERTSLHCGSHESATQGQCIRTVDASLVQHTLQGGC